LQKEEAKKNIMKAKPHILQFTNSSIYFMSFSIKKEKKNYNFKTHIFLISVFPQQAQHNINNTTFNCQSHKFFFLQQNTL
jgi:hypothetical protein